MPAQMMPSVVSRDMVQVELRISTSTSPEASAVNRSFDDSGTNFAFVGSLKIAAAIARQYSTSRPVQLPCWSGTPKPAVPGFAPQTTWPFCFTLSSVPAEAAVAIPKLAAEITAAKINFFIPILQFEPPSAEFGMSYTSALCFLSMAAITI